MSRRNNTDICGGVQTGRIKFTFLVMMIIIPLFLNACATVKPIGMVTEQVSVPKLGSEVTVFVLRPLVAFERLHDEAPLDSSSYNGRFIESIMKSASERVLRNNKIKTTAPAMRKEVLLSHIAL
jgi:hypothetical protein